MTTHSLLEELRDLGVKLSSDGITLNIDAPKGVITPTLWEQLTTQKQELITLLATGNPLEDERLHAFASAISHMVDVLGGAGTVRITRHDPSISFEELVRQIRPPYQPVTLPALPRSICPFRILSIKRKKDGDHLVRRPCQGKTLPHGWCADHARSHDLLCLGALLGYPSVEWERYAIGEGVVQWEGYAECVSRHLARDIASIRTRFAVPAHTHSDKENRCE